MPMIPFMERFPDVGVRETRFVKVPPLRDLPEGEYGFVELYCDEPGCDCRRVMIFVLQPQTGWSRVWAAISYGWEKLDFYRKWSGCGGDPNEIKGPYLDPLNPQTKYSPALLELFEFLIQSPDYVARLRRHYLMFRKSIAAEPGRGQETGRLERKRASVRDVRRRRRNRS